MAFSAGSTAAAWWDGKASPTAGPARRRLPPRVQYGLGASMHLGASLDPRRHASQSGGKPEAAVGFSSEGGLFGIKFTDPLEESLAAMGVTQEEWDDANQLLRASWAPFSKRPTIDAIEEINTALFAKKGLVAVYAEHGLAQKASPSSDEGM